MCPNPTLLDLMETKPQHYLNERKWLNPDETGMQWGIRVFLACYPTGLPYGSVGSSTLVSPRTWSDLQARHRLNTVSISISMKNCVLKKRTPIPKHLFLTFAWHLHRFSLLWAQGSAGGGGDAVTDRVPLGPLGATDVSMFRATVTAFFYCLTRFFICFQYQRNCPAIMFWLQGMNVIAS